MRAIRNSDQQGSPETEPIGYAYRYMREYLLRELAHTITAAEKAPQEVACRPKRPKDVRSIAPSKSEHLKTTEADDVARGLRPIRRNIVNVVSQHPKDWQS